MSNIINAIYNLVNNPVVKLTEYYRGRNRANNVGDALEEYIKDLFCNSFNTSEVERINILEKTFSYLGNNNNPPDIMLKNGDAIEVKKIESSNSSLALNSSYPKYILKADNPMISKACKEAEDWIEKDIIYAVGIVDKKNNNLKHLCMVYGKDYCASDECYSRIKNTIKNGVEEIPNIEFSETKELGHVNKIDPLGITYLRVRGMWGIKNPWNVFDYIYKRDNKKDFSFMCIINEEKWNTLDNKELITNINKDNFSIIDIKIKNPDNPVQMKKAKLITFSF